ncbi:lysine--tRNA ligase [Alphaproteobacteria bacterium]|nr:lysine--tRNA ligase [Alphaproteobacteria bacterium]MDC0461844.1 lysine--tRNA ligase [Alphaproteobacteria bacterium]
MTKLPPFNEEIANLAEEAKAWPFAEARNLMDRLNSQSRNSEELVTFETGYGPSGLPHIGTFGEVVRTSMVRHAFEVLTGKKTRLVCFSDDMDGLRKVPDNVPNQEELSHFLEKPLTQVPDPFGTHSSFGAHNNARLKAFLDSFGFEYEFLSATELYQSGKFDTALLDVLNNYEKIINIILPTLGADRQATYSPFLPICPNSGKVLQVPATAHDKQAGTISYLDPVTGDQMTTPVTGGKCKLQWKADWAMRWHALGVDYEMSGKDLIDSVTLSTKIVRALGSTPPTSFSYELFLDQNGEKISKSKGNGLSVEEWLTYGNPESLSLFMYAQPKRAKRLFFDIIPKTVDEYYTHLGKIAECDDASLLENPTWHIHSGKPVVTTLPVSFSLLLNLAGVCSAEDNAVIWSYVGKYAPGVSAQTHPQLDRLISYAVRFYQDRVRPEKSYRLASAVEKIHLNQLKDVLSALPETASAEDIQNQVYAVGKQAEYENLREWFSCLYQILLGQTQGPRMGSFFKLYGLQSSLSLIEDALNDTLGQTEAK